MRVNNQSAPVQPWSSREQHAPAAAPAGISSSLLAVVEAVSAGIASLDDPSTFPHIAAERASRLRNSSPANNANRTEFAALPGEVLPNVAAQLGASSSRSFANLRANNRSTRTATDPVRDQNELENRDIPNVWSLADFKKVLGLGVPPTSSERIISRQPLMDRARLLAALGARINRLPVQERAAATQIFIHTASDLSSTLALQRLETPPLLRELRDTALQGPASLQLREEAIYKRLTKELEIESRLNHADPSCFGNLSGLISSRVLAIDVMLGQGLPLAHQQQLLKKELDDLIRFGMRINRFPAPEAARAAQAFVKAVDDIGIKLGPRLFEVTPQIRGLHAIRSAVMRGPTGLAALERATFNQSGRFIHAANDISQGAGFKLLGQRFGITNPAFIKNIQCDFVKSGSCARAVSEGCGASTISKRYGITDPEASKRLQSSVLYGAACKEAVKQGNDFHTITEQFEITDHDARSILESRFYQPPLH